MLLALSLLKDYSTPTAIQLLEKDQNRVLQAFEKSPDLFKAVSANSQNHKAKTQVIGLVQRLLIFAGGREDFHQFRLDRDYTAIDNVNFYGSLVSVTGSNRFGDFDLQSMLSALSKSKAITSEDIDALDISELRIQMMTFLPIGFQSDLV